MKHRGNAAQGLEACFITPPSTSVSSDLPVRLHGGVAVLAAVLRRRHHHPEGRGPGDGRGGPVDRLQVAGSHRSPRQGEQRDAHARLDGAPGGGVANPVSFLSLLRV